MTQAAQVINESRGKFHSLEAGRFIAALLVLICHLTLIINGLAATPGDRIFGGSVFAGALGLQYFFVLSGFVMAHAHHHDFGHIAAIPRFWWRRACRLYPTYWLAVSIPIFYLYKGMGWPAAWHVLSLQPLPFGPQGYLDYIQAAWSLRFEVAFYIILGLGMLPYVGKPLLGLWIFVTYWRWFWSWFPAALLPFHPAWMFSVNRILGTYAPDFVSCFHGYFVAGLAAGLVFVRFRLSAPAWKLVLVAGTISACLLLPGEAWGSDYGGNPHFMLYMAAALACVISGLAGLERHGAIRLGRYAGWAGALSYPLYLFHEPLLLIAEHCTGNALHMPALYLYFAVMAVISLTVAALVAFLFDLPIQHLLRSLTRRIWHAKRTTKCTAPASL